MTLAEFTELNLLVPELLNERQESVILELSKRLADAGRIENACVFAQAVLKHESLVSTVFDRVAFCLARGHTAVKLSFAMGLSKYGIPWGRPDAPPVFMVVLFAIPVSAEKEYLPLIMTFSSFLDDKAVLPCLRESQHSEEIFEVLKRARLRASECD